MTRTLIMALLLAASAGAAMAQVNVQGYTRRDGTYVQPHQRTAPDSNPFNNYSAQGNVNPYTGQQGNVNPYNNPPSGNSYNNGFNSNNYGTRPRY